MCYSLWYNVPTMLPAGVRQHRGCIIPQAVTHSLVLLKMGKILYTGALKFKKKIRLQKFNLTKRNIAIIEGLSFFCIANQIGSLAAIYGD